MRCYSGDAWKVNYTVAVGEFRPALPVDVSPRACTYNAPSTWNSGSLSNGLRDREGTRQLTETCIDTARVELHEGQDVKLSPHDLLCRAIYAGDTKPAASLLGHGYDVNASDSCGYAPLEYAAMSGSEAMTALLLTFNANTRARPQSKTTALGIAILCGHIAVVRILLKDKTLINTRDPMLGSQPLHYTIRTGNVPFARTILEAGADSSLAEHDSWLSPLQIAQTMQHTDMVNLLLEYGAKAGPEHVDDGITVIYAEPESVFSSGVQTSRRDPVLDFSDNASGLAGRFSSPTRTRSIYDEESTEPVPEGAQ